MEHVTLLLPMNSTEVLNPRHVPFVRILESTCASVQTIQLYTLQGHSFPEKGGLMLSEKNRRRLLTFLLRTLIETPIVSVRRRGFGGNKRSKKRKYTADFHFQLLNLRTSQPQEFWKVVSKAEFVVFLFFEVFENVWP